MSSPTICPRIDECQNINGKMGTTNYIIDTLAFMMTVFIIWASYDDDQKFWFRIYGPENFYICLGS